MVTNASGGFREAAMKARRRVKEKPPIDRNRSGKLIGGLETGALGRGARKWFWVRAGAVPAPSRAKGKAR